MTIKSATSTMYTHTILRRAGDAVIPSLAVTNNLFDNEVDGRYFQKSSTDSQRELIHTMSLITSKFTYWTISSLDLSSSKLCISHGFYHYSILS